MHFATRCALHFEGIPERAVSRVDRLELSHSSKVYQYIINTYQECSTDPTKSAVSVIDSIFVVGVYGLRRIEGMVGLILRAVKLLGKSRA